MSGSERRRELTRRRKRLKKVSILKRRAVKANTTEKLEIARKLRGITPGAESIITELNLEVK